MVTAVRSLGLAGIAGYEVTAECFLSGGLPAFDIVGLPDAAVREARERVRAAVKNCGAKFPVSRITVNLAPAGTKKAGTVYDLPIFVGLLACAGELPLPPKDAAFIGELSLTGALRGIAGVLPMALAARETGIRTLYVPAENAREATLAGDLTVIPVKEVRQLASQCSALAAKLRTAAASPDIAALAADALGETVELLRPATTRMITSLENAIDELQGLSDDEYMDTLVDILGGDPAVYGQYFPEMVQTSVNKIYPIENYGSAMTPFYTVLAIWVGGVILSSLVKIHARTEGLVNPKPAELYFGRYLFFFVLSQIQAAVIVTGDLFLLKVQCLHPGMMYLTGALTAFTFSLLIYSLAISFGDVGKAIVVVIMVMQIAGSSGTFPIELLPEIYQKFYRFFPFPYAIDAMRECICGMYGSYYWQQIGFLLLFAAAALLIGLLVRRPFMGLNHFMEEKLEETELL